jgi:hypothetical protein
MSFICSRPSRLTGHSGTAFRFFPGFALGATPSPSTTSMM